MPSIEVRYRMQRREFTAWERFSLWWSGVRYAFLEKPPDSTFDYVEVREGEFGYNDAPFRQTFLTAARFQIKDGQYVPVAIEDCQNGPENPEWKTPNA